jgi:hypothetical protein
MRSLSLEFYTLSGFDQLPRARYWKFDLHELPGSVQILHLAVRQPVQRPI